MSATVGGIAVVALIKDDNEQTIFHEVGIRQQRRDVGFQPSIGGSKGPVVGVVQLIGHDEGIIRQIVISQIGSEMRERNQVHLLHRAVHDVAEVRERVMVPDIRIFVAAGVSGVGQALGIGLPIFAHSKKMANNIVGGDGGHIAIAVSDDLPGGHHEVIADRRVSIGVVLGG